MFGWRFCFLIVVVVDFWLSQLRSLVFASCLRSSRERGYSIVDECNPEKTRRISLVEQKCKMSQNLSRTNSRVVFNYLL